MRWIAQILLLALTAGIAFGQTPHRVTAPNRAFAERALALQKSGADFDHIFTGLCDLVLSNVDQNPKLRYDDQARAMFGGLWLWTRQSGRPLFQGQPDKALHFIWGGTFEGYWDAGRPAAVRKEQLDMQTPGNAYDLDDLAATIMGTRWVDVAANSTPEQARRWFEMWASGRCTLTKSLPKLHWGRLKPGTEPSPAIVEEINKEITEAVALPTPAPLSTFPPHPNAPPPASSAAVPPAPSPK